MAQAALVAYAESVQFSSPTVSITIPTNVQVGNTMLLQVHRGPTGSNSTTRTGVFVAGTGWTELNSNITGSATTTMAFMIYTKIATPSDPGSVVTIGNVDTVGIVQGAIITAWTGPIVRYSTSIGSSGSGGAITFATYVPTSAQTTGNTQLVLGAGRSNGTNGSVGFFMPATGSFTSVPVIGYYNNGMTQSIQGFIGHGTIPTTKTSTLTVTATSTLNSRAGYWIELGPGAAYARNMTARVSMRATGRKNPVGIAKTLRATVLKPFALAQQPPIKGGFLTANVAPMRATGQRRRTGGTKPLTVGVSWIARGSRLNDASGAAAPLRTTVTMAAAGFATRFPSGMLRLGAAVNLIARGRNSDHTQYSLGLASLSATARVGARGYVEHTSDPNEPGSIGDSSIGAYYEAELLASTAGYTEKGVTLAAGQGLLAAGICIARSTVDRKYYRYDEDQPDLTAPIGILRTHVQVPDDKDTDANVLVCGIVHLDAHTAQDIERLKTFRGAKASVGRNLLVF